MKGIIFNLLQEIVESEFDADTWDAVLDLAGAGGVYTSVGSYEDDEMMGIVGAAATHLGLTEEEVLRWFGSRALAKLAERFPNFFAPHTQARDLLLTLNQVIHPEVEKLYPGAYTPVFQFSNKGGKHLTMEYQSKRQLCALAEGFILGTLAYFDEQATVTHPECVHRGDARCVFELAFA